MPLIEAVSVNGLPVKVTLDTGSSLALELYPWAVEGLESGEELARAETSSVVGARGEEGVKKGRVESVRLGPFELGAQEVVFRHKERQRSGQEEGNVGNAILQHFVLTLDYVNGRIALQTKNR
ncbi:MAG: retropepsin-like aspartic protease [Thermoanaerobaculia bacterium]